MAITKNWKQKTEASYGRMGLKVAAHPWRWLLGAVVFTLILASQLVNLRTDTTIESFLSPGAPAITQYNKFRDLFGRDEFIIVTVETEEIFKSEFIEQLRELHQRLEDEVPYVDTVDSLINARHTYGENDTLVIEDLLSEELPSDPEELAALKDYTYNRSNYENYLISSDHKLISILIKIAPYLEKEDKNGNTVKINLTDVQFSEAIKVIRNVTTEFKGTLSQEIQIAGSPTIGIALGDAIKADFTKFTFMALTIVGFVLFFIFRRTSGVLMPILVMSLGVTATISTMAIFNTPMQMTTAILPSFLMAVCVGNSIHLLSIFYQKYDSGKSKEDALCYALEHTGLAMFFTSITTAAGLASFSTSELFPVANLGIYGAIGALFAFLFTILMLPCLIVLSPLKRRPVQQQRVTPFTHLIDFCVHLATQYPKMVSVGGVALFITSVALASQLGFSHDALKWFPEDHPVRIAIQKTEDRMGGTMPIEVVIDTGKKGGATDPALLNKIEKSLAEISQWQSDKYKVAKVISLTDIVKETHRALNDNNDDFYIIPSDQALIRQELFLVEMDASDQLFQLTDPDYRIVRNTIILPWIDAVNYGKLIKDVENHFNERYSEADNIDVTGMTVILGHTFAEMLYSTGKSYALAAVVISIMMIILLGSVKVGLISMLPNLLPIAVVLALMKLLNMPLDMFTLLIGSIAIGLTVDDTVHFMHGFKRAYGIHQDAALAVSETLHSTGRAMLVTTVVLALGFLIYTQSTLNNLKDFGVLTALCLVLALFADFLLAPALMMLMNRKKQNTP